MSKRTKVPGVGIETPVKASKTNPATVEKSPPSLPDAANPPAPLATVRPVDLASLRNVRQELEHIYWQVDRGELQDREAKTRCYVLNSIYQVLASGLEKRVEAMEKAMRARGYQLPEVEVA